MHPSIPSICLPSSDPWTRERLTWSSGGESDAPGPSTRTASLFTNGTRTAEGYTGLFEAQAGRGAGFGVSKYLAPGSGLFQLFRFEIFT